jgi:eukaryotic-like serine/threonine-protein kinase
MPHNSTMTPALPARIGPYPIHKLLGAGSMGNVYLGHDPMIDRPVAVKTIQHQPQDCDAERARAAARFRVEAQAAGRLNHRGIVAIYQFGDDQDCSYIAMEYVAGHSLRDYLMRSSRFSAGEALGIMFQLLDAMQFAHDHGVVHRDIKPANLIVARDGRIKITDFGIARMEASTLTRDMTRPHVAIGTPGYMAPEQYTGGEIDRRTDIFSAGVVLYQLLSGRAPFSGPAEAVMYQIVYGDTPPLPRDGDDDRLAGFDAVLSRAMAKQPGDRYADALALRDALVSLAREPVPEVVQRAVAEPAVDGGGAPSTAWGVTRGSSTGHRSTAVPTGWNESTLSGLERELAVYVGPLARVLVRRSARSHSTLDAVRREVATAIVDPQARERFVQTGPGYRGGFVDSRSAPAAGTVSGASARCSRARSARSASCWCAAAPARPAVANS